MTGAVHLFAETWRSVSSDRSVGSQRVLLLPDCPIAWIGRRLVPGASGWGAEAALVEAQGAARGTTEPLRFVTTDSVTAFALGGLCRTIEIEQQGTRAGALLLDAGANLSEALTACPLRGIVRWGTTGPEFRDFETAPNVPGVPLAHPGDHILITGGNGAIAQSLAAHITSQTQNVLITLLARSEPNDTARAGMQNLTSRGARVLWVNLTSLDAIGDAIDDACQTQGPLKGILHCAGVTCDRLLANPAPIDPSDALAAKLNLTRALDMASAAQPLRYFVGFSSLASVVGNEGQAGYALANGALDGLIAQRRDQGRCGVSLSVNWGYWQSGGMRIDTATEAQLRSRDGVAPMTDVAAIDALQRALGTGVTQCAAAAGDAAKLAARLTQQPACKKEAYHMANTATDSAPLLEKLTDLVARATKRPAEQFLPDEPFASYGIDSLLIVRILGDLELHFGTLPRSLIFEHVTLVDLAGALAEGWPEQAARWTGSAQPTKTAVPPKAKAKVARTEIAEIVIVGLAGRFPKAASVAQLWDALELGVDAIGPVPEDRWDHGIVYDPDPSAAAQGRSYANKGAFLEDFASFDPAFFGLTPRKALEIDPQERLFLMACWHALESAGLPPLGVEERTGAVGVFAGVTKSDHSRLGPRRHADGSLFHPRASFSSLANRVSYHLGLSGPSQPVDTMCSASLTAIHQARRALQAGDCTMALVGGVNLYQDSSSFVELCQSGMLSTDGRCRSFGEGGAGFGPGEGVGVLVLTTAELAKAQGLRVEAKILSTAINHGGAASGYTVPNPAAQRALIEATITGAGLSSRDIDYVEAHGTGTALGDPIEIEGLTTAFANTGGGGASWLGSVKSNIGHLEAAAGVSGVIKAIGQVRRGKLFASLHAETVNPALQLQDTPFDLVSRTTDWPGSQPKRSLVSSFGAGGSNACLILESQRPAASQPAPGAQLILLSAKTEDGLRDQAKALLDWVFTSKPSQVAWPVRGLIAQTLGIDPSEIPIDVSLRDLGLGAADMRHLAEALGARDLTPDATLADLAQAPAPQADIDALAYTLQTGRVAMACRIGFVAHDTSELIAGLEDMISESSHAAVLNKDDLSQAKALSARADIKAALAAAWSAGDLARLQALWCKGITPDWATLWQAETSRPAPLDLPGYPFSGRRIWAGDLHRASDGQALPTLPASAPAVRTPVPQMTAKPLSAILALTMDMEEAKISLSVSFADYGLDSILGIRFVDAINAEYGTTLKSTAIFEHPTLAALESHIGALAPTPAQVKTTDTTPGNDDAIAIIGMSGRYAGATDLSAYWDTIANARPGVGPVARWALPETVACRNGGFLDEIDQFDPTFFNISGAEARYMDPQQRIFLEECWHALERAGYAGDAAQSTRCGIFVGCCGGDYQELFLDSPSAQSLWGNMASVIPARIAYYLDLQGPAIAIDTACSSSLVAVHSACTQLRAGELDMALAGGVFVQATSKLYLSADKAGMLSPTGQSYSFDKRADGFVPGEGAGVVLLKRLADALRDRDPIDAVILGSQINQNGKTNGITAPSGQAQAALLEDLYARAGVDPTELGMIETHGTGTALGDPIEFDALAQALARGQGADPIWLTSVKPAIGHTQFAAGVAGLQKLALSLKAGQIPPNLFFDQVNPRVDLEGQGFAVPTATQPWPAKPRRVGGVSSFGASGTNAHVILAEAPDAAEPSYTKATYPVCLSARSEGSLRGLAMALRDWAHSTPDAVLGDVAYTLLAGRGHFEKRIAFVAGDIGDLVDGLESWLACQDQPDVDDCSFARGFLAGRSPTLSDVFAGDTPRRIALPVTPLDRAAYWVGEAPKAAEPALRFTCTPDEGAVRVCVPAISPLLMDHVVGGQPTLPGFSLPEIIRAALDGKGSFALQDLTFLRPITAELAADLTITRQGADVIVTAGSDTVARATVTAAGPVDEITEAAGEVVRDLAPTEIYRALTSQSIAHGPHFQALKALSVGTDRILATLCSGADIPAALEPTLLDAAVQAAVGFDTETTRPTVPYSVDAITFLRTLPAECTAVLTAPKTLSDGTKMGLNIDLRDANGTTCVALRGVTARTAIPTGTTHAFLPVWQPLPWTEAATRGLEITPEDLGNTPDLAEAIVANQGFTLICDAKFSGVSYERLLCHKLLWLLQELLKAGAEVQDLSIRLVTSRAVPCAPTSEIGQGASLHGLFGALANEYPHWSVTCVDTDDALTHARKISGAPNIVLRSGQPFRLALVRLQALPQADSPYKSEHVYVVIGGAGGVGRIWTRHVLRTANAQVIWLGRSPLDDRIRGHLRSCATSGAEPVYIQADARDAAALATARDEILHRYGRIDGVVLSAIGLSDASIARMNAQQLDTALTAKLDVTEAAFDIFADYMSAFGLVFSSLQSFSRMAGQGNYAAGSTFADSAAQVERAQGRPVTVVNWGYWADEGIVATQDHKDRQARFGQLGLTQARAMAALDWAIVTQVPQLAIAELSPGATISLEDPNLCLTENAGPDGDFYPPAKSQLPDPRVQDIYGRVGPQMDRYDPQMALVLCAAMQEVGFLGGDPSVAEASMPTFLTKWLDESHRVLDSNVATQLTFAEALAVWDAAVVKDRHHPDLKDHIALVDATLRALPQILAGDTPATDVIFPEGRFDLVSGVYDGSIVADYFNDILCDALEATIKAHIAANPGQCLRIAEVGAGTGGTARKVFARLAPYVEHIETYLFTDLSKAFLINARQSFNSDAPYLDTAIFNASSLPGEQGLEEGSYDIVIATNVLHATADILQSVSNAKAFLKRGGVIMINELIQPSLFSHLTFGLLEGWWAYDDAPLRMQGTPALDSAAWNTVLTVCGFQAQRRLNPEAEVLGQQVFVGESDGVVARHSAVDAVADAKPELVAAMVASAPVAVTSAPIPEVPMADVNMEALQARLAEKIAQAIEIPSAQVDQNTRFERYGVDSILILQLVSGLRAYFPSVTSTLLFEADTVAALADHLAENCPGDVAAFVGVDPAVAAPAADSTFAQPAPVVHRETQKTGAPERAVAIIGMAGKFAGAPDLATYWNLMSEGRSAITDAPSDGRSWVTKSGQSAGYLDGADRFDPLHFSVSPAEAERMDPQERLFLMAAYHAMENAGYAPQSLSRQGPVGVFAAAMNAHYPTRAAFWSLANRLSFLFDFTGPSLATDTACSASLTALSMAVDSLRLGRCRTVICGGVNVIAHPRHIETLDQMGIVSPSGQINAFGAYADGMVSGEGVGAVVLKRLDHACADGDRIEAVIKGIAINSGGRTSNFTAPSPKAQAEVVSQALEDAGVSPHEVSLVEAHGTGTRLGDPVEVAGLSRALTGSRAVISSVKPNIGHCESAAGFAGLFKLILQMQHRQIVPSLGAEPLNTEIDLDSAGFSIPARLREWPADGPRHAGLSSFGAGGANGHLILSEAPDARAPRPLAGPQLCVLSARTQDQLRQLAEHFASLDSRPDFAATARTLQLGRDQHVTRLAVVASDWDEWQQNLRAWLSGAPTTAKLGTVAASKPLSKSAAQALWAARDLAVIADLWTTGHDIDWDALFAEDRLAPVALPLYPFAQDSYWIDAPSEETPNSTALEVLPPSPSGTDVIDVLRAEIATLLKLPPESIDAEALLEGYGLDSIMVIHLTEQLEAHFGELPKTLFFEYRTLRSLAQHLDGTYDRKAAQTPARPLENASDIAIIGVAGRYPGADTLDQFWDNLRAGRDSITEIPRDRWDHTPYFSSDKGKGKTRSKWGGFLTDVDAFDAPFFGMLPKDAELADPQERLFLETSYHAIESAGHRPETLGQRVGVFVGVMYEEYQLLGVEQTLAGTPTALSGSPASIANRVSYALDLTGPSMAVDTMCSSSLSAIHLAVRAVQNGECEAAVAGGVNLTLHPNKYLMMAHGGFEASDGRCCAFGAGGDGYVPSEGVGAVVLKPVDAAERDGDPILAVIKGSAVNHGGRANGYTVPDPVAQGDAIADALARSRVTPDEVSFVECHGTGTSLGDPIEIAGLRRAYGDTALSLGSVKANIGHCESAAGIAGLTKLLLQLRHAEIAPNIHAQTQNPDLGLQGLGFDIPLTSMPWPQGEGPRIAGLSSFGAGGSNAHLVIGEYVKLDQANQETGPCVLPLSAASADQLAVLVQNISVHLEKHQPSLAGVAFTLQTGRRDLKHRCVVVADNLADAIRDLRRVAPGLNPTPLALPADWQEAVQAWLDGLSVDWPRSETWQRQRVTLPGYPFAKHRYWGVPRKLVATPEASLQTDPVEGLACFTVDWKPAAVTATRAAPEGRLVVNLTGARLAGVKDAEVIDLSPDTQPGTLLEALVAELAPIFGSARVPGGLQLVLPNDAPLSLVHAVCGFVGSLRSERSGLHGQVIQIAGDVAVLAEDARSEDRFIRYNGGQRLVRALVSQTSASVPAFAPQGAVIIAGGAGGIGLHFARHLSKQNAGARLVLLGRGAADARINAVLNELKDLGAVPSYHALDIADEDALARCLQDIRAAGTEISAVINAAGVLRDGLLMATTPQDAATVAAPKIAGTLALDRATRGDRLEAFVLCSSLAGLSGNMGQSSYAFANGWQDGFVTERAAKVAQGQGGGRSVSINWPLWAEGGMTVPEAAAHAMSNRFGLEAMPTDAGMYALNAALHQGDGQFVVGYGRPEKIIETLDDGSACAPRAEPKPSPQKRPQPVQDVLAQLRATVAEIVRVAPEDLDVHEALADLGFDSIAFTELAAQCTQTLGVQIDPSLFYSNTTLAEVSTAITEELALNQPDVAAPAIRRTEPTRTRDPIAIVGMSGAFPGANSIDQFWQNLQAASEVISEIPGDRWDWRAIWGDPKSEPGKSDIKFGGFLEDLSQFDPLFFGISPREAAFMDPHQRLLLTHVWRALEDAGIAPTALAGSSMAVFMATSPSDYADMAREDGLVLQQMSPSSMVGSISPNRISAHLDLHGPSEPVETACSSGLVALHRAVEAIHNGCDGAIVGATNTMMMPYAHVSFARSAMLSPEGRCRTFDANANGYVRSEAVCSLVLKPLSFAQAEGLPIYGVIRGSGVNHSGKSSSLFAPNAQAQQALIEQVWHEAGVTPQDVGAIELHGTGTAVGDPIEFAGIAKAVESFVSPSGSIALSSVKSHVGHAEVAAGLVGLIKMLLQMRHGTLIPDRHRQAVNPAIKLDGTPFELVDEMRDWSAQSRRVAGVSSFGFGGVNAHVVVENAPEPKPVSPQAGPEVFILSAQSEKALKATAQSLLNFIGGNPEISIDALCATVQLGRAPLRHRLGVVAASLPELEDELRAWLSGRASQVLTGAVRAGKTGGVSAVDVAPADMAQTFVAGQPMNWREWRLATGRGLPPRLRLPATAMDMRRCWYKDADTPGQTPPRLIGEGTRTSGGWRFDLSFGPDASFLTDHVVQGRQILPATAYIEIARAAAVEITGADAVEITGLTFRSMVTGEDVTRGLSLAVRGDGPRWDFGLEDAQGKVFATGKLGACTETYVVALPSISAAAVTSEGARFYEAFQQMGIDYGPAFRLIQSAELAKGQVEARLAQVLPEGAFEAQLALPPNMLDAALQTTLGLVLGQKTLPTSVPVYLDCVRVLGPLPRQVDIAVAEQRDGSRTDIQIKAPSGTVLVDLAGLKTARVPSRPDKTRDRTSVQQPSQASLDLVQTLKTMIAEMAHVSPDDIASDAEFSEFGLTSINFAEMGARLETLIGAEIAPTLFYESPSVDGLAARLKPAPEAQMPRPEPVAYHTPEPATCLERAPVQGVLSEVLEDISALIQIPRDELDADISMAEFGFDSLLYAELGSRLTSRFAVEVKPILFYGTDTVGDLCAALVADYGVGASEAPHPELQPVPAPLLAVTEPTAQPALKAPEVITPPAPEQNSTDIAIIGMSGAFPGADSIETFWANLMAGRDVITRPPEWRWDWRAVDGDPRTEQGKTNVHWGGFTDSVAEFDPEMFGMSPTEAELTDPQQRVMMTHSWAAIENAGYAPASLAGTKTGLYMGTSNSSYCRNIEARGDTCDPRWVTGNVASIGPSRISHLLNLQGPSEPFETACSSSLVALHRAVEDLKAGYTDMALAGGVNVIPNADMHVAFASAGMLSPDGRCKTFDASANGYVRGEGVGIVVLKRLADARRDGDEVLAVVKASGVAHAGRAASLTAPNPASQASLIAEVIGRAGVDASDITCWEAHGTGTALGDPIEIEGLKSAFKSHGAEDGGTCVVGTAKSHIGHLEVAAGVAGLIKAVLQMRHRRIAGNLNFETLNPAVKVKGSAFDLALETREWQPAPGKRLMTGVSSFGFGGVNASVLLEEGDMSWPNGDCAQPDTSQEIIVLSARSAEALTSQAKALASHVEALQDAPGLLARVSHTLQVGREAMPHRLAFVACSVEEMVQTLRSGTARSVHVTQTSGLSDSDVALLQDRWVAEMDISAACDAWLNGLPVDWPRFRTDPPRRIALPSYPFARDRYWVSAPGTAAKPAKAPEPQLAASPADSTVLAITAAFLGVPSDEIDSGAGLGDLGIDSIGLMTIVSRLQAQLPALKSVAGLGERLLHVRTLDALQKQVDEIIEPSEVAADVDQAHRLHLDLYASSQKSDPMNLLISRPSVGSGKSARAEAELIIDEDHPLFFDHPLDHVSGLHLSEAISQLVRADVLYRDGADPRDPVFLRLMKFEFPNFCQKAATQITAHRLSTTTGYDYHGEAVQNGKTVARGRLSVGEIPSGFTPPKPEPKGRRVTRQRVNKHLAENVLLSNLKYDGMAATALLSVAEAAGFYNDFNGPLWDSIVLLEAVRQLMRSYATRSAGKVACYDGVTFLRDVSVRLDRPIYTSETVAFKASADDSIAVGGAAVLIVSGQILEAVSGCEIGEFSTSAATIPQQLKDAWEGQRAPRHAEKDSQ